MNEHGIESVTSVGCNIYGIIRQVKTSEIVFSHPVKVEAHEVDCKLLGGVIVEIDANGCIAALIVWLFCQFTFAEA